MPAAKKHPSDLSHATFSVGLCCFHAFLYLLHSYLSGYYFHLMYSSIFNYFGYCAWQTKNEPARTSCGLCRLWRSGHRSYILKKLIREFAFVWRSCFRVFISLHKPWPLEQQKHNNRVNDYLHHAFHSGFQVPHVCIQYHLWVICIWYVCFNIIHHPWVFNIELSLFEVCNIIVLPVMIQIQYYTEA